jgi:hypothetical protein
MPRLFKLSVNIISILGRLILLSGQVWAQEWRPVRGGTSFGISGRDDENLGSYEGESRLIRYGVCRAQR